MSKKINKKPLFTVEDVVHQKNPATTALSATDESSIQPKMESNATTAIDDLQPKNYADLEPHLAKLRLKVGKLFKAEFVNSLVYLIRLEYQPQAKFEATISELDWKQVDYLVQQLKKICKNKKHIITLINIMQLTKEEEEKKAEPAASTSNSKTQETKVSQNQELVAGKLTASAVIDAIYDYSNLISEVDTFDTSGTGSSGGNFFSLISIMIRFLYKLIKSASNSELLAKQIIELVLMLLSCIADFCYYEEIRIQVNIKVIFGFYLIFRK